MSEVVLLVGHGSREPAGNREVEDFATRWRARHPEWDIELCFIEFAEALLDAGMERSARRARRVKTGLKDLPEPVAFAPEPSLEHPRLLEGTRIGVARDLAFSFVYPANLDLLRALGAELVFFSPLRDTDLPAVDSVYLPGGYPELHIEALANNQGMKQGISDHVAAAKPLLAECGGMLYLLDELSDREGQAGSMCGILPGRARMQGRLMGLGLQSARFESGELRGHTFHHSALETSMRPSARGARQNGTDGEAIYRSGRLTASYLHWYLPSAPAVAAGLLRP